MIFRKSVVVRLSRFSRKLNWCKSVTLLKMDFSTKISRKKFFLERLIGKTSPDCHIGWWQIVLEEWLLLMFVGYLRYCCVLLSQFFNVNQYPVKRHTIRKSPCVRFVNAINFLKQYCLLKKILGPSRIWERNLFSRHIYQTKRFHLLSRFA